MQKKKKKKKKKKKALFYDALRRPISISLT